MLPLPNCRTNLAEADRYNAKDLSVSLMKIRSGPTLWHNIGRTDATMEPTTSLTIGPTDDHVGATQ